MRIKVFLALRPADDDPDPLARVFFRVVGFPMRVPSHRDGDPGGALVELHDAEELEGWADAYFGKHNWDLSSRKVTPQMVEAGF